MKKRQPSPTKRLTQIRDRINCEMPCSNEDAKFIVAELDRALTVNAALIIARHQAAEEMYGQVETGPAIQHHKR